MVADLCNECSNCEVYCPESGAPFKRKEWVFATLQSFHHAPFRDGFCRQALTLHARIGGVEMLFEPDPQHGRVRLHAAGLRLELDWNSLLLSTGSVTSDRAIRLDTADLWRMKLVWESIFNSDRPNWVNPNPPNRARASA